MNGAVYMSFFQGQLESVLEQVVQLAVQEISKTVGSSLNGLLLETAVKEQENRRLGLQLQAREKRGRASASDDGGGGGSPVAGKNKAGERADSGRAKPEQQPGGQGTGPGVPTDTRRLEQRGRVVGRHPLHNTHTHVSLPINPVFQKQTNKYACWPAGVAVRQPSCSTLFHFSSDKFNVIMTSYITEQSASKQ